MQKQNKSKQNKKQKQTNKNKQTNPTLTAVIYPDCSADWLLALENQSYIFCIIFFIP